MLLADEAFGDGMIEELEQSIEVAVHVQQTVGLPVQPELSPRPDLEELLEAPEAARQQHERVGEIRHQLLPLVHGVDAAQVGQSGVGDLARDEMLRDHPDHAPAPPSAASATIPISPTLPPP